MYSVTDRIIQWPQKPKKIFQTWWKTSITIKCILNSSEIFRKPVSARQHSCLKPICKVTCNKREKYRPYSFIQNCVHSNEFIRIYINFRCYSRYIYRNLCAVMNLHQVKFYTNENIQMHENTIIQMHENFNQSLFFDSKIFCICMP